MKKEKDHPFYCRVKKCRKTAWETPEYLSDEDWNLTYKLTGALLVGDKRLFDTILYDKAQQLSYAKTGETNDYIFFNRIIGWVEGKVYYPEGTTNFYFDGLVKHDLHRLKQAIKDHEL